jgi:hypothetical protein
MSRVEWGARNEAKTGMFWIWVDEWMVMISVTPDIEVTLDGILEVCTVTLVFDQISKKLRGIQYIIIIDFILL